MEFSSEHLEEVHAYVMRLIDKARSWRGYVKGDAELGVRNRYVETLSGCANMVQEVHVAERWVPRIAVDFFKDGEEMATVLKIYGVRGGGRGLHAQSYGDHGGLTSKSYFVSY